MENIQRCAHGRTHEHLESSLVPLGMRRTGVPRGAQGNCYHPLLQGDARTLATMA